MADGGPEIASEAGPGGWSDGWPDGWTGPLDLLLEEARRRRVDLARIPLAALVDACLARLAGIPSTAEKADQLVLAATLAEMKARLLLPPAEREEGEAEAARLRARLIALERVQALAAALMAEDRLGRDVFARGAPQNAASVPGPAPEGADGRPLDLLDLVRAYARLRIVADAAAPLAVRRVFAMTLRDGLEALGRTLPEGDEWVELFALTRRSDRRASRRSAAAAGFVAALEMARRGEVELRQERAFGEMAVRRSRTP